MEQPHRTQAQDQEDPYKTPTPPRHHQGWYVRNPHTQDPFYNWHKYSSPAWQYQYADQYYNLE